MPRFVPVEKKEWARRLRAEGASLSRIAAATGMAKSTVSLLVRDLPLTREQKALLALEDRRRVGHLQWSRQCRQRRREAQLAGRVLAGIGDPGFASGVMLYWAEGTKSRNQARIANSDVDLLRMWLRWLDAWYDVPSAKKSLTINCFLGNGLELAQIEQWWLDQLDFPRERLKPSVVNTPSRASKAVHRKLLYGTASISVTSTFLVQSIYGAIQEIGDFDRPEWLDLGGAMPEHPTDADGPGPGLGG